jgi:hypothetical protein
MVMMMRRILDGKNTLCLKYSLREDGEQVEGKGKKRDPIRPKFSADQEKIYSLKSVLSRLIAT